MSRLNTLLASLPEIRAALTGFLDPGVRLHLVERLTQAALDDYDNPPLSDATSESEPLAEWEQEFLEEKAAAELAAERVRDAALRVVDARLEAHNSMLEAERELAAAREAAR